MRDQVERPVLQAQQVPAEPPEVVVVKVFPELAEMPDRQERLDHPEQRGEVDYREPAAQQVLRELLDPPEQPVVAVVKVCRE
jgi:hypothetical protein